MSEPTQEHCPSLPEGDNSTHHLVPTGTGFMTCQHCGGAQ